MMNLNSQSRMTLLAAALAGAALVSAGCGDRSPSEPVSQKTDTAPTRMANATDRATTATAAAVTAEDDAISAKVKAAIVADPGLSTQQINVDTKNAVVTLNGNVNDSMSKTRAMQVVQTVNGVRTVIDNLAVKPAQSG
jgi:hyperosmotically inducible protein